MTFSFIQAIEHGHATTYGTMLNSMRSTIYNNDLGGNYVTYFPTMHPINDRLKQVCFSLLATIYIYIKHTLKVTCNIIIVFQHVFYLKEFSATIICNNVSNLNKGKWDAIFFFFFLSQEAK